MPFPTDAPEKIRDKLDRGVLPREAPGKMYAGFGQGHPCDGCDQPIAPTQVEYELDSSEGRSIRLHLGCAGLWEAERRRRGWTRPTG
ncbi:MAG TPA: hypothetical protein VFX28_10115 [Methylomirabilota bacterium]|nr:hypothetical protein [Methylomirabilota bacterium]